MLAPMLRSAALSSRAALVSPPFSLSRPVIADSHSAPSGRQARRTYSSPGGSTAQPIRDGARDLGGKAQDNTLKIAAAAVALVGGAALWWQSAKTEGESLRESSFSGLF